MDTSFLMVFGIALVAALAVGLVPAWRLGRTDLEALLRGSGRTTDRGTNRLRSLLLSEPMTLETETLLMFASRSEHLARVIEPAMASEDFAFLLQEKPGCYVFLGNGDGEHRMAGHGLGPCMLHNASYDFNDALIPAGASYWIRLAQRYLA